MTQNEIIEMARKAGLLTDDEAWVSPHQEAMERFATLVAAHEREACAVCPSWDTVDDAIAAEREACAKVCEGVNWYDRHEAAAAIRARGEK